MPGYPPRHVYAATIRCHHYLLTYLPLPLSLCTYVAALSSRAYLQIDPAFTPERSSHVPKMQNPRPPNVARACGGHACKNVRVLDKSVRRGLAGGARGSISLSLRRCSGAAWRCRLAIWILGATSLGAVTRGRSFTTACRRRICLSASHGRAHGQVSLV